MRVMVRPSSSCQQHHGGIRGESDDDGEATTPDTIAPRRLVDASAVAGAGKSPRAGVRVASPNPSAASPSSRKSRRGKRTAASRSPSPHPDRSCRGSAVSRANGVNGNATDESATTSATTATRSRRAMTPPPNGTVRSPKAGKSPRSSPKKTTPPAAPHLKVSVPVPTSSSVGGRASAGPFVLPRSGGRRGGLVRRTHSPKTVTSPLSKPVNLSEISICPAPPITGVGVSVSRPRPIFPANLSSGGKKRKRKPVAPDAEDSSRSTKRQAAFMPAMSGSSSSTSRNSKKANDRKSSSSSSRSRSRSPKSPRSQKTPSNPTARVLSVAPTVRGISEAARILRMSTVEKKNCTDDDALAAHDEAAGILSFPTETVYTLTTCVRIKKQPRSSAKQVARSSSSSSVSSMASTTSCTSSSSDYSSERQASSSCDANTQSNTSLNTLLGLKGKGEESTMSAGQAVGSDRDPPLLYVHSPSQHRQFYQFTRPKTFMIKKATGDGDADAAGGAVNPSPSKRIHAESPVAKGRQPGQVTQAMVPAVTFSESREVLDRVTAAFWPGPVAIYAPAKLRRVVNGDSINSPDDGIVSLVVSPSGGEPFSTDSKQYAPILPASVLVRRTALKDGRDDAADEGTAQGTIYVGIRCPSHPLARRVLEEVYYKNTSGARGSPGHRHCTRSNVVVGFDASIPHASAAKSTSCPTRAREVCIQLLSPSPPRSTTRTSSNPPAVHVLNGEDKREQFSHVTCEFGAEASVSLIVDDASRTIRILKRLGADGTDSHPDVCSATVMRALLKTPPQLPVSPAKGEKEDPSAASAAARVVTAVLQRWRAVQEIM